MTVLMCRHYAKFVSIHLILCDVKGVIVCTILIERTSIAIRIW